MCRAIRTRLVEMSHQAGVPHLGSSLSCVEILAAAYWGGLNLDPSCPDDPDRDRFILSKGHAASTLYAALALRGFFPLSLLDDFAKAGSRFPEHPSPHCLPGVEVATGSLGHGLSLALGMALAGRIQARKFRSFAVLSDGECNEGTVWEAALFAGGQKLDRVGVIIDYNKWQATGRSNEVMALEPMREKWNSFGWSTYEIDGHDLKALGSTIRAVPDGTGKPVAVVAHTVKGKGVSFMEDDNNWHYRVPSASELAEAKREIESLA
ncbi:MAG: transketolase [Verrucomicrobia bacterium]|nr:transketolase [Verrucomicrobiota bacterium]